ncbi:MAG: hypothetical protein WDM91_19035 [Rhizomicrobium sp.]
MSTTPDDDDRDHFIDSADGFEREAESLDEFIAARPLTALALAAAFGFVVARLVF